MIFFVLLLNLIENMYKALIWIQTGSLSNLMPSIIAWYEKYNWSAVWIRPIRYLRNSYKTSWTDTFWTPSLSTLNKNKIKNKQHKQLIFYWILLTNTKQQSTKQNVPERPMPALQCTTAGPTLGSKAPESRTCLRNCKKATGELGMPKSGHVV